MTDLLIFVYVHTHKNIPIIYTCKSVYTLINTYVHTHMYVHAHTYLNAHTNTYIYTYLHIHMYMYTYIWDAMDTPHFSGLDTYLTFLEQIGISRASRPASSTSTSSRYGASLIATLRA